MLDEGAISELRGVYPDAHMIDDLGDAPARGLWARHVHGLSLAGYDGFRKRRMRGRIWWLKRM